MSMTQTSNRIHPLLATAAVSVTLVSLVGIAAITGVLPSSHGSPADGAQQTGAVASLPAASAATSKNSGSETMPREPATHTYTAAAAKPARQQASAPAHPQAAAAPVAQNSPIGIGVGAVVGGLLGNQMGGGNGKALATIAGAVGGGYLGNEIAKKNQ
ncbi:MAG: glycine zipper 2TM domain-containing protein [Rhodoferax sp.]|uniref:glycine zipper 2TM domain-containing protein n=1 Tax=Rhodoferax sp. TaxID=50421 RepID=UPI00261F832E|nr:glycine zipper 2TM domain-containing protein [Rhodoferax sp.]MDD5334966.1 glycine zipper 2TM domain-containing protein [Rhodoferax sp.]